MKVLHVTTHLNIGGITNYIVTLSRALKKRGVSVTVASSGGDLEIELDRAGIGHMALDIKTKNELSLKVLKSIFGISRIIRTEKIDIVHAHTRVSQVASFFACRFSGVAYVTTCHGFFRRRLRRFFDTWGNKVIAISDAVVTHLEQDLGVSKDRIELVYNGIEVDKFSKVYSPEETKEVKRTLGLSGGPVVGTIGRLSPVKGQRSLIEAMKYVAAKKQDAQGLIVGGGKEEADLKNLARSLGLEKAVHFSGPDMDTGRLLSIMDVFVFPSIKEGLGLSLLEALAARRACVASSVGGIASVIQDGFNGLLVGAGDAGAMSDSILRLLDDDELRKEMGRRGRALVEERFSIDLMAEKVIGLYKNILKEAEV